MRVFPHLARALLTCLGVALLASCSGGSGSSGKGTKLNGVVTVYSTTDSAIFEPVIEDFTKLHPEIRLRYVELDAQPLFDRFVAESQANRPRADILLSSAMDLQVKLVNDGFAQVHRSENADKLPSWARWRNEIFGLTFEPVVMVTNPDLFATRHTPQSRIELVQAMRADRRFWKARIGTYDVRTSSVGYLLASQDARLSSEYGALIDALGDADARTYQNISVLLDDIETGKVALGYNVLGSYAKRRVDAGAKLRITFPEDYTLAIVRAAFIARNAPNPDDAHVFLEYLMSLRGQRILATQSDLSAAREEIGGSFGRLGIAGTAVGPLRPIPIGPGLLTYLDQQKRERFLANWQAAVNKPE